MLPLVTSSIICMQADSELRMLRLFVLHKPRRLDMFRLSLRQTRTLSLRSSCSAVGKGATLETAD